MTTDEEKPAEDEAPRTEEVQPEDEAFEEEFAEAQGSYTSGLRARIIAEAKARGIPLAEDATPEDIDKLGEVFLANPTFAPQEVMDRLDMERTQSFTNRVNSKLATVRKTEAFRAFFDLAAEMNEAAHNVGIKEVKLDADSGDVTVTYRTRPEEAAQSM